MKKTILAFLLLFIQYSFSQEFEKFPYSAFLSGVSSPQEISIIIKLEDEDGITLYKESHITSITTSGEFNVVIGDGDLIEGQISSINWEQSIVYISSEIFTNENPNGILVDRSKIFAVPYSLVSKKTLSTDSENQSNNSILNANNTFQYVAYNSNRNKVILKSSSNNHLISSWSRTNQNVRLYCNYNDLNVGDNVFLRNIQNDGFYSKIIEKHTDGYTCEISDTGDLSGESAILNTAYKVKVEGESNGFESLIIESSNDKSVILNSVQITSTDYNRPTASKLVTPIIGTNNTDGNIFYPLVGAKQYASLTSGTGNVPNLVLRHVPESYPLKYRIQGMEGEFIEYLTLTFSF
jgi:hypothetical protein|tara:strand:- start:851 stop:1903 length:1053 start_codon:yes stop_codon:yes gene_type:complete